MMIIIIILCVSVCRRVTAVIRAVIVSRKSIGVEWFKYSLKVVTRYKFPPPGRREPRSSSPGIYQWTSVYKALVLQQNRLRWYGHVLRKDDDDWVKKCMEHEVEGSRPRGRPKKTWKDVVREDCQARKSNKEDRWKWRKMIKEAR